MEFVSKREKRRATAAFFAYLFLIVLSVVFLAVRGLENLKHVYVINITADLFGMLLGYVLYICYLIDAQKTGSSQKYFVTLINVAFFGMFTDIGAWLVDGIPSLRYLNLFDNMLYYMCAPVGACFLWFYVLFLLKTEGKLISVINRIVQAGLVISLFLRFISVFTGLYFTVDEAGVYSRGSDWYPVSLIYSNAVMVMTLVLAVAERKKLALYQLVALFLYVLAPLIVGIFTAMVYGLSVAYAVVMLEILLMYCMMNITRGRDKVIADRDLTVASAIQQNMLPRIFPPYPDRREFDLYASMTPAKEVGGDFYDFFLVDDDHLALVIADVSGKGVPAALFMMVSKVLIKNRLQAGDSPGDAISNVNDMLANGNTNSMFVTVWCCVLEIPTGKMIVVNAGHEHPAIRRKSGEYELCIYDHSTMVGMFDGLPFDEHTFTLNPGDSLFVYTDGVPEAQNLKGGMFGTDRMLEALNRDPGVGPEEALGAVMDRIVAFRGEALQFDDITMLCLRYNGGEIKEMKELKLKAELSAMSGVLDFIGELLDEKGCPKEIKVQIDIAVEEMFVNICHYAYAPDTGDAVIKVSFEEDPRAVSITFIDSGVAFDPVAKPDPDVDLPIEERPIGGLGIYMVKQSMDNMYYERKDGQNILTIRKLFAETK